MNPFNFLATHLANLRINTLWSQVWLRLLLQEFGLSWRSYTLLESFSLSCCDCRILGSLKINQFWIFFTCRFGLDFRLAFKKCLWIPFYSSVLFLGSLNIISLLLCLTELWLFFGQARKVTLFKIVLFYYPSHFRLSSRRSYKKWILIWQCNLTYLELIVKMS